MAPVAIGGAGENAWVDGAWLVASRTYILLTIR
jgi:hypothetical protein